MDQVKSYQVDIEGITPLLMHSDDVEWADGIKAWDADPKNKKFRVPGDDRSPAFRWLGSVWHANGNICVPQQAVSSMLSRAGAGVLVPGAQRGKTFKAQAVSAIRLAGGLAAVALLVRGKTVSTKFIDALRDEMDFAAHQKKATDLGFYLDVRRATIGQAKHVRVRPRFDVWALSFLIDVFDSQVTEQAVTDLFTVAGERIGLGDWRPSSPKRPGPFGMFKAAVKAVRK